jgi:hypothetical protein
MSVIYTPEGRPCAPINPREVEDGIVRGVTKFAAEKGEAAPHEGWLRIGIRNGWLSGWHQGFRDASADRSPKGGNHEDGCHAQHESAVPDRVDAQKP